MSIRVLLAPAIAVLVLVPASSARVLAGTWNGTWETEWGAMTLRASGSGVTGTYPHDSGRISGTATGNKFKGRWTELPTRKGPGDAGAVEFSMSADGKKLTGRWTYDGSPTSWHTDWNGECKVGACVRNTSAPGAGGSGTGGTGGSGGTGGGGSGGGGGSTTTTTGSGSAAAPTTGTATGAVLVNGVPFTTGTIPFGATVDVTQGSLVLVTATGTLKVNGAGGISAVFKLLRGRDGKKAVAELRLVKGDFSVCPKRRKSSATRTTATTVRQLWGDGSGSFRTRGRFASATIRGTKWLTADRCDGTQIKVSRGVVAVADFPQRRVVTLAAGRSYLARP